MRGRKVRISPEEVKKLGRRRKKNKNKPRRSQEAGAREKVTEKEAPEKTRSRGVREGKVEISPGEVKKPGRRRKKNKNKPRRSQEAGA